ncbi:alpha-1,6-glucosidase domain-containing protein [uncultured Paraglaciecola sp.]|uniref:alpha-1,6-glucosidase domain-containing protein n=1 Tax=uncultured Paraglaciecola sp. TaxID=1765024 RepID=UPI0030D83CEA|tara:strand:- start:33561 stop:37772 length:4212 start_codon:yes stop_codon:yes gene_type:complete
MSQSKTLLQLPFTIMAMFLASCGSGGGNSGSTNPAPVSENNAPTISRFSNDNSAANPLEVTFSWTVSDPDSDALSCVLSLGNGLQDVSISDCITTNSTVVSYTLAGVVEANLTVTDPSHTSTSQSLSLTLENGNSGLPQPIVMASDNELVIFYNRPDGNYQNWVLHLWNNQSCDAYADFASDGGTEWTVGQAQSGVDSNYGAYWVLPLKADHSECANFIVHKGDEKDIGDADHQADLTGNRMIWALSGIAELYAEALLFPSGVLIADTAAHWVDTQTVFWDVNGSAVAKIRIYSSAIDDLGFDGETGITGNNFIEFTPQSSGTHPATSLGLPRYQNLDAYTADTSPTVDVKQMLTGKLLAIAYDSSDAVIAATYVQTPRVLDAIYTAGSDDANEALLGLNYSANSIQSNVWAPTAQQVKINIYDVNKTLQSSQSMTLDNNTGIWSIDLDSSVDRQYYRFELTVYHHINQRFETIESTDPYSVSLSTNGSYSQFVNLDDDNLKPQNWDTHVSPSIVDPEDAVIYEGHIRDFSIRDESTSAANRGKYLAFTEQDSLPVSHLKSLADAGLTHFQLLPANDIATIGEDLSNRVNITDTVADLCALNSSAPVCGVEDGTATLLSVFESYDPSTSDAQALANAMGGLDSFNWGYDPKHYSTPEGSYASDPDGTARILEMRAMIQSLHEMGLRVSLDVVYNHTSSSGVFDNSVLDKVVPGYYHRRNLTTGNVLQDTCCEDTAPEHQMMDKLMVDSLALWTQAYKFDAFRFDIMSNNSTDSILNARDAVQALDSDNYFYGEGWTRNNNGYTQANQNNMAGSEVGTFNDRPRDIIRSASLFSDSGSLDDQDIIRLGLAGTLADYSMQDKSGNVKLGSAYSAKPAYGKDPADIINYVSKHDNETLWDQLQYGLSSDLSVDDRVRAQNIAGTIPFISQGIPFFQLGGDLIRSKSMDRNTYDAGDWYNWVDFTKTSNNWNIGLPLAQDNQGQWNTIGNLASNIDTQVSMSHIALSAAVFNEIVAIRQSSKLFRLTETQDVIDRLGFHNTGVSQTQGLIVMSLDDGAGLEDLDGNVDAIVVVINGTSSEQSHNILTASGFELHSVQQSSADSVVQTASFVEGANSGTFTVPALTTAVFVKPQVGTQGTGLAADVTVNQADVAPFGDTTVYLRGSMNNFGDDGLTTADSFSYVGNGVYNLDYLLDSGTQNLKIASDDYALVNLGFSDVLINSNSVTASADADGNISFTVSAQGNYNFQLDASQDTPVLTIDSVSPTVNCSALEDSAQDIPFNITGGGQLYVRGSHSGWGPDETYRLHYKGNNTYQAVAEFSGDFQFKLASDDGSWTTQLWAQTEDGNIISENLTVGISYPVAFNDAGETNNQISLTTGTYSFLLTLNESNPSKGSNVGSLNIQQCLP